MAWPAGVALHGSSTIAYGQQMLHGALDRDFLFLQNTVSLATSLFLYQSTEVDLHQREGDGHKGAFRLTNTFFTANYQPLDWFTMNLGYDATRPIEFLETHKNILDSLLDKHLRQGFRSSLGFRLPMNICVQLLGGYRLPAGEQPSGYSAGSAVRVSGIGGLGLSMDGQYMHVKSPYTEGNDMTAGIECMPLATLTIGAHWNHYAFTPLGISDAAHSTISTITGSVSWYVTRGWYVTVFADRVRDSERLLYRCFAEMGYHF